MSTRFLFPCPACEKSLELQPVQAGQEIQCEHCQKTIVAPKLGDLKRLPMVGQADPKINPAVSGVKRFLFAGGLALTLLFGLGGFGLYSYASMLIQDPMVEEQHEAYVKASEAMSPSELLQQWEQMKISEGLGEWEEQPHASYRTQGQILQKIAYGILTIGAIGLMMMIGSFLVSGR